MLFLYVGKFHVRNYSSLVLLETDINKYGSLWYVCEDI